MRIMSNNTITKEEVHNAISEIDAKQNKKIHLAMIIAVCGCACSIVSLAVALLK